MHCSRAMEQSEPKAGKKTPAEYKLSLFDTTNLVIGAAVGADIYVVAAQGARYLGPAVLAAWAIGGVMAIAIALSFAQCALILPQVGGSYAYARAAFGHLVGFIIGWCLYLSQIVGSAVFPLAFTRYLAVLIPGLTGIWEIVVRALFVFFIAFTNYIGVRAAGRVNDSLTLAKLFPLIVFVLFGTVWILTSTQTAVANLTPFAPLGWAGFFAALNPIFWAYAGFEVAPLPAEEVQQPRRTLPLALWWGMLIVTALYVLINVVVVSVLPTMEIAGSATPLVAAADALFEDFGLPLGLASAFMVIGAAISIGGVGESITLGVSRLPLQLAADGYFPRFFARQSRRFGTPSGSILFSGGAMFLLSFLGSIELLIAMAVFYLSLIYLGTALAAHRLAGRHSRRRLAVPFSRLVVPLAVMSSLVLVASSVTQAWLTGLIGLALAVPFYFRLSPKVAIREIQSELASEEYRWGEMQRLTYHFLADFLRLVSKLFGRIFH